MVLKTRKKLKKISKMKGREKTTDVADSEFAIC